MFIFNASLELAQSKSLLSYMFHTIKTLLIYSQQFIFTDEAEIRDSFSR